MLIYLLPSPSLLSFVRNTFIRNSSPVSLRPKSGVVRVKKNIVYRKFLTNQLIHIHKKSPKPTNKNQEFN